MMRSRAAFAETVSSIVSRCIQTDYLFVFLILILVVTPWFFLLFTAMTIIGLADCSYDGFMDEESFIGW
jgi:hypothetical protein